MFTGLIEETGRVRDVRRTAAGMRIAVSARITTEGTREGDSICVDGVCLTAVKTTPELFEFDVVKATMNLTTLGGLRVSDRVNLERALRLGERLGGHLVTGHADGKGKIASREGGWVKILVPSGLEDYFFPSSSIAVDGASLTVQKARRGMVEIALIPKTMEATTLGAKKPGSSVNIEVDIISKQVVSLVKRHNIGAQK